MKDRYIAIVDLGSSFISLCVTRVSDDGTEILYYDKTPSDGVRNSCVFNPKKASEVLKAAVQKAENDLRIKITQVVTGLPRYPIGQESAYATMERTNPGTCISEEEVAALKYSALQEYQPQNPDKEDIYAGVAQAFNTDDEMSLPEDDVVGMISNKLEGNFRLFIGEKRSTSNIDTMLDMAGLVSAYKFFTPITTANAVLTVEEKENGVALIEIGGGVSSVTIFQGGLLRYYSSIPFGGKSVTGDIKYECNFKESLAENIKLAFGACMPDRLQTMSDKIIQVNYTETGTDKQIAVKYLSEIITARYKELYDAVLFKIQESGYSDQLRSGIVLTGGAAGLLNCGNYLKYLSGYNVRMGYPRCSGMSVCGAGEIKELSAASIVGMILYSRENDHLNCSSDYVPQTRHEEVKAEEDEYAGTVLERQITPDKPEKPKRIRTVHIKAPTWTYKLREGFGNLFDDAVENNK